ncbi:MAG: ribonuclease III [Bacteroidales bacterium]|nr:ribonuclease III [Bacteroidales bacterium]
MWFGRRDKESEQFRNFFKNILGYTPRRTELYHMALRHRSLSTLQNGHRINNERLEYLGDAVLGAVVADYLYKKYPYHGEGFLTELRSKIVSRVSLNRLADKIGLVELVEYQHDATGGFKSIGGDAFEALMGAMYIDKGFVFTRKVIVNRILGLHLDVDSVASTEWNYKSKLIDWGQKNHKKVSFEVVRSFVQGRHGRRHYECMVRIDGAAQQSAIDFSIKAAEQLASEKTYKNLVSQGTIVKKTTA